MPFKNLRAVLGRAKSLFAGVEAVTPPVREARSAPDREAGNAWGLTQDKSFWVTMAGADRRLAELRRAIDQAAAEATASEVGAEGPSSIDRNPPVDESRCARANRMISQALGDEGSLTPPSTR